MAGQGKTHGMSKFWKNSHEFSVQEMFVRLWGEDDEMFETWFPSSHLFRRGLFKSQRLYQAQSAPQIVLWKLMPHFYGATMAAKSVKTTFVQKCFLILFFQYFERLRRRRWWKMAKFVQKVCAKTLSLISSLSWKVGNWGWGKWIG